MRTVTGFYMLMFGHQQLSTLSTNPTMRTHQRGTNPHHERIVTMIKPTINTINTYLQRQSQYQQVESQQPVQERFSTLEAELSADLHQELR